MHRGATAAHQQTVREAVSQNRISGRQVGANHFVTLPGNRTIYTLNAGQLGNGAAL